jgi:two-component system sensor histidine kinase AlgZ
MPWIVASKRMAAGDRVTENRMGVTETPAPRRRRFSWLIYWPDSVNRTRTPLPPALASMKYPSHLTAPPPALRTIGASVLLWSAISVLGALQTYSDNLRGGVASHYPSLLVTWFIEYAVPLIVLSAGLSMLLARLPALLARPRNVVLLFVGLVVVFQPAQWTYMAWLRGYLPIASLHEAWQLLRKMLLVGWFSTTGTFAGILALHYARRARERELAWQRGQSDMLALRLALEEQRVLALHAQLEPHFLFNALSAISALVRDDDKAFALDGIDRLSELLRYTLAASVRTTSTLGAELQFVRDYLDLQRLRYGARLRVHIDGDSVLLHDVACAPLLLQPLIENALRHDLDCHAGPSDIRLHFAREGDAMFVRVTNPLSPHASPNPGAGLGLANMRDRLRLMHPAASLRAGPRDGRYIAEVRLPLDDLD